MGTHRSLLLAALILSSCGAPPVRIDEPQWRERVQSLPKGPARLDGPAAGEPGPASAGAAVEAATKVTLPPTLQGPLLAKSFLRYELTRGHHDAWDIRFQGPERIDQSVDSWASVTLSSPSNKDAYMVKSARVYSGRINVAERGEKAEDSLLLLALAFTDEALFDACEALGPMDLKEFQESSGSKETAEAYVGAYLAGFAGAFTVQRTGDLTDLMAKVLQWPSGWLGVDDDAMVAFRPDVLAAEPCETTFGPAWTVPLEIQVGGQQAFVGEITVVKPGGALHLAAGIVEATGYAPDLPDHIIRLRLAGANAPRTDQLAPGAVERFLMVKPRSKTRMKELR